MNVHIGLPRRGLSWVKAAHVIFVIFWMAGLFMLPRYLVYHQEATPGSAEDRAWIEREDQAPQDHPDAVDAHRSGCSG